MGRAKQHDEPDPSAGSTVLFTSLMILLLAFFILLNAISDVEEAKVEAALQSLSGTFGIAGAGESPLSGSLPKDSTTLSIPMTRIDEDYLALRGVVMEQNLANQVKMLRSKSMRTVVLPAYMLFKPDGKELSPWAQEFLDKVAKVIKSSTYPISLMGHTDDAPATTGDSLANFRLSAARALTVAKYLAVKGVKQSRLAAFGMAGNQPMVPNKNPEHRRLNNRVSMVFDARDESMHMLPQTPPARKLDFRGFSFDLMQEGKKE